VNISFFHTQDQVRDQSKTVTRRLGWKKLKPGTILTGIVKGQGLKKGEKVQPLCTIKVVHVRRERLWTMTHFREDYGHNECRKEGFPHLLPEQFVDMFCRHMKCEPFEIVTRIEFEYLDKEKQK